MQSLYSNILDIVSRSGIEKYWAMYTSVVEEIKRIILSKVSSRISENK